MIHRTRLEVETVTPWSVGPAIGTVTATACLMPDAWERANDLNPEDPNNGDGYTNLEEYVSSLSLDPLVR